MSLSDSNIFKLRLNESARDRKDQLADLALLHVGQKAKFTLRSKLEWHSDDQVPHYTRETDFT